jgi:hypothetical protein
MSTFTQKKKLACQLAHIDPFLLYDFFSFSPFLSFWTVVIQKHAFDLSRLSHVVAW